MDTKHQPTQSSLGEKLYIYYLNGRLENTAGPFSSSYIGNWEEGDTSFLFFSEPAWDQIEALLSAQPQLKLTNCYCMSYGEGQVAPKKNESLNHLTPQGYLSCRASEICDKR